MKIKLKIFDAKYPSPNYYAFEFFSEYSNKRLVVNENIWQCMDVYNHSCAIDVTENIRTILKDSPAKIYDCEQTNSKN
jgi:hypothetical protein